MAAMRHHWLVWFAVFSLSERHNCMNRVIVLLYHRSIITKERRTTKNKKEQLNSCVNNNRELPQNISVKMGEYVKMLFWKCNMGMMGRGIRDISCPLARNERSREKKTHYSIKSLSNVGRYKVTDKCFKIRYFLYIVNSLYLRLPALFSA